MNNRKTLILGILLVIIGVILIGSGIFYPKSVVDLPKQEELTELSDLDSKKEYDEFYSDLEKIIIYCNSYLHKQYPISDFNKISSQDKTLFLLNILDSNLNANLTVDSLEKEKLNYFYQDTKLYFDTIKQKDGKVLYRYDKANQKFTYTHYPVDEYIMLSKEVSNKIYSTKWIVKRKVYYMEATPIEQEYPKRIYKNSKDAEAKKNEIFSITDNNHLFTDIEYEKVEKQLTTITYTFTKIDGKYKLLSIENDL